jgi:glycosyltransferase involved in cell wall biosynthesis
MVKFSILVSTVPRRVNTFFPALMTKFLAQVENRPDIEILGFFDNKKRSVGQKRNELLRMAQGEFLTFIDDDDDVPDDYVAIVMDCLYKNPAADCVVYDCITTINGDPAQRTYSKYGIEFEYGQVPDPTGAYQYQWRGKPAHTMVWKSDIAKRHLYKDANYGEDVDWVVRACTEIKNQVRLDKVLYYYNFNNATTETRG